MPPYVYVPIQSFDSVITAFEAAKAAKNQSFDEYVPRQKDYLINISGDDGFKITDIEQGGETGDCWLLACLAGVAHTNPQFLQNHIIPLPYGKGWIVTIYDEYLKPHEVEVNQLDLEVLKPNFPFPELSKGDLWVNIYEMAFQKIYYANNINNNPSTPEGFNWNIHGGSAASALQSITGKQVTDWEISDYLKVANTGNYIGIANNSQDFFSSSGFKVVGGHSYTILSFDKIAKTITLNNPWGYNKNKEGINSASGELTLSLKEFNKYFSDVCVSETPS